MTRSFVDRWLLFALFIVFPFEAYSDSISGEVISIADGDTLTILDSSKTEHKIRLAAIDAPEKAQPFGQKCKRF